MAGDGLAIIDELAGGEILVVAGMAADHGAGQGGLIAHRRHLAEIGQTRGIAIGGVAHAQGMGFAGHHLGEIGFAAADGLADHHGHVIGRFGHQCQDGVLGRDLIAGLEAQLGRRLGGGMGRDRQFGTEMQTAGFQLVEQQEQSHDLGQRRRIAADVGIGGVQDGAAVGVDHDGGGAPRHRRLRRHRQADQGGHRPDQGETKHREESGAAQVQRLDLPFSITFRLR